MKITIGHMAALILGLAVASCDPPVESADGVHAEIAFDPAARVGATTCTVRLSGPDGEPLEGAILKVEGNMNHAGMVPVFADAEEREPGRYEAPFGFTMGGDWFVIVRAALADGRAFEALLDVPAVAAYGPSSAPCCATPGE